MKLKNLKNMREAAGLTQKQASEKIGVGQSAVSMWETGAAVRERKCCR